MDKWEETILGNVCTKIGSGATPRGGGSAYQSNGISLIRSQNVLDYNFSTQGLAFINETQANKLSNVIVEEEDVLINITGDSVARVCQVLNDILPARVNQHVSILRTDKKSIIPKYLKYYLLNPTFKRFLLILANSGGTRNALTKGMLEDLIIILPDIPEQKAIAAVLSSLDDKIELLRNQNQTLEKIAQTLFKHWFVDFEFPNEKGHPYKSSGGKMVDSELGDIPEGWRTGLINEITEIVTKGTTPTTIGGRFAKSGINFIKAESITDAHHFDRSKFSFIDDETNKLLRRSIIKNEDLLFTIAGTIGRYSVVTKDILPANTNQAVAIIRVNKRICDTYYLKCCLGLKMVRADMFGNVVEAVQANLSLTSIKNTKIIIPDVKGLQLFTNTIKPIFIKINFNNSQIQTLSRLRDTLLPKLMSGKLKVKL